MSCNRRSTISQVRKTTFDTPVSQHETCWSAQRELARGFPQHQPPSEMATWPRKRVTGPMQAPQRSSEEEKEREAIPSKHHHSKIMAKTKNFNTPCKETVIKTWTICWSCCVSFSRMRTTPLVRDMRSGEILLIRNTGRPCCFRNWWQRGRQAAVQRQVSPVAQT